MTKNKKIELLANEVKTLQQKLNSLSKAEDYKISSLLEDYNKTVCCLINELELEKMQYRNLRKELEKVKKKYEELYNNTFNNLKKKFSVKIIK